MDEEMTLIMQLATGGGVAAIITGMILVFLWPVRTAAIDWIKSKTPQIALLLGVLLLAGCASVDRQSSEAEELTINTVGAEWFTGVEKDYAAGEITETEFKRRERKWFSWRYRVATELGKEVTEPGRPTEKELAEATAADLTTLGE
jgi:hypothetical protein